MWRRGLNQAHKAFESRQPIAEDDFALTIEGYKTQGPDRILDGFSHEMLTFRDAISGKADAHPSRAGGFDVLIRDDDAPGRTRNRPAQGPKQQGRRSEEFVDTRRETPHTTTTKSRMFRGSPRSSFSVASRSSRPLSSMFSLGFRVHHDISYMSSIKYLMWVKSGRLLRRSEEVE